MRVELRIRRLVLDESLAGRDQAEPVLRAVREELSHLLAAAPARSWQASRRLRGVLAPTVRAEPGGDPAHLGRAVARSVASGVSQGTEAR